MLDKPSLPAGFIAALIFSTPLTLPNDNPEVVAMKDRGCRFALQG